MSEQQDWVRAELARLPRPDMPDDVRQRLDAALRSPALGTGADPGLGVPAQAGAARASVSVARVPAQSRGRSRRSLIAGLMTVAAGLALFAVINPLAQVRAPQDIPLAAAPSSEGVQPEDLAPVLLASNTSYSSQSLPDQVGRTMAAQLPASPMAAAAPEADVPGPSPNPAAGTWPWRSGVAAATAEGVASCLTALGVPGQVVLADRARFEGRPALVVAMRDGPSLLLFVLDPGCTSQDAQIRYRATVEAP